MEELELGEECIEGSLSFIKQGEKFSFRSLIAGNPAKLIKEVTEEMIQWKTEGTRLYQQLPRQCYDTLKPCEPLREQTDQQPLSYFNYEPFKK